MSGQWLRKRRTLQECSALYNYMESGLGWSYSRRHAHAVTLKEKQHCTEETPKSKHNEAQIRLFTFFMQNPSVHFHLVESHWLRERAMFLLYLVFISFPQLTETSMQNFYKALQMLPVYCRAIEVTACINLMQLSEALVNSPLRISAIYS